MVILLCAYLVTCNKRSFTPVKRLKKVESRTNDSSDDVDDKISGFEL